MLMLSVRSQILNVKETLGGLIKKSVKIGVMAREDIAVPTVKEVEKSEQEFEYLFFVGSMGSYDNRSQKIAQSFAHVMNVAGIKFAILGNKEKNSGDTPRRIGNEFLFQELATANIDTFQKHNVKKIVTIDPHAYNSFKNEYPEFGLRGRSLSPYRIAVSMDQRRKN